MSQSILTSLIARKARRSWLRPPVLPLRFERLEDRSVPSTTLPLTSAGWVGIGPATNQPETLGGASTSTIAYGNLPTAGRVLSSGVIHTADPNDQDILYVSTSDGGVAVSRDDGRTWATETEFEADDPNTALNDSKKRYNLLFDNLDPATEVYENGTLLGTMTDADRAGILKGGLIKVNPRNEDFMIVASGNRSDFPFSRYGRGLYITSNASATTPTWRIEKGPGGVFDYSSFRKVLFVHNPADGLDHIFVVMSGSSAVYHSADNGVTWDNFTENLPVNSFSAQVTDISFATPSSPTSAPNVAYVAVSGVGNQNGVYRTQEAFTVPAPTNWLTPFGGTSNQIPGNTLSSIRVEAVPQNPSTVYILSTSFQAGGVLLYRSKDSGTSFAEVVNVPTNFGAFTSIWGMVIDPTTGPNRTRMYLYGSNGIRVLDVDELAASPAAVSYDITTELPGRNGEGPYRVINDLTFDRNLTTQTPFGNTRLIASTDAGVFRLENQIPNPLPATGTPIPGMDWTSLNGAPGPLGLNNFTLLNGGIPAIDDNRYIAGNYENGTLRFEDLGGVAPTPADVSNLYDWPRVNTLGGEVIWDYRAVDAGGVRNTVYQVSDLNQTVVVNKSTDGGVTWSDASTGIVNPNQFFWSWGFSEPVNPTPAFVIDPSIPINGLGNQNVTLLLGTDVVNRSTDSAGTWAQFGPNLPFVTGTDDRARATITNIGVGRADRNVIYASVSTRVITVNGNPVSVGGALYRLDMNPQPPGSPVVTPAWREVSPWISPIFNNVVQQPDPNFQTAPSTSGWRMQTTPYDTALPGFQTLPRITDISVDPSDSNIVYLTLRGKQLTEVDTPDPATRDDVTGAYTPYDTTGEVYGRVLRSTDGGVHWQDISYKRGLPDVEVYTLAADPNRLGTPGSNDDDIYIGTELGVWKLTDPSNPASVWQRVGGNGANGLPDVAVRDLDINTDTGLLMASTFGRGAWAYPVRPVLSGFIFTDTNGNGTRDTGESPLGGVNVEVVQTGPPDISFATALSDTSAVNQGFFRFGRLPNGDYRARALNSNALIIDPSTTYQLTTTTTPYHVENNPLPTTTTGVSVGVFQRTSILGTAYNDINSNGMLDSGEPVLPNWTVELRRADDNSLFGTTTTDANGIYSFNGLGVIPGGVAYRVVEQLPPGWIATTPAGGTADITLASGVASIVNFGNFRFVDIGGVKYEDYNGNGVRDGGEPGLLGWTIQLINATSGALLQTTTTDLNGAYQFAGLPNGNYRLREVPQGGWSQSSTNLPDRAMQSGESITNADFGNFRNVTIVGNVLEDMNGNGTLDNPVDTRPLAGITLGLFNAADPTTLVQSAVTDGNGGYAFHDVQAAGPNTIYLVRIIDANVSQTAADASILLDSSGSTETGSPLPGFRRTTLAGFAFEDLNGNGVREAGEPPLVNTPVNLINAGTNAVVATTSTDGSGNYIFTNIPQQNGVPVPAFNVAAAAGTYLTTPPQANVMLMSGTSSIFSDIGIFKAATITGMKFNDLNGNGLLDGGEPGLAGWEIHLLDGSGAQVASTITDAAGGYSFTVGSGTYTVQEVQQAGWVQTSTNPAAITTTSASQYPGRDIGNFQRTTITGTIYHDLNGNGAQDGGEPGLANWTIQLVNADTGAVITNTVSDGSGNYTIASVPAGSYRVIETVPGGWFTSTPNPVTFTAQSGQNPVISFGNFFGATLYGNVFEDLNRNAIPDSGEPGAGAFTVRLTNAAGVTIATTTSDDSGNYTFLGVPPGTYTISLAPRTGWTQTTGNPTGITPASGSTTTASRIGAIRLGSITGRVYLDGNRNGRFDSFERVLPAVTIGLYRNGALEATATPDSSGQYAFYNLDAGSYIVRPVTMPAGMTTTVPTGGTYTVPIQVGSTNSGSINDGRDFGLIGRERYAIAADGGGGPRVQVYDAVSGSRLQDFFVYETTFTGGVRVAMGDVNGDGVDDLAVVAGKGGGPRVRVFDGVTNAVLFDYLAYEETFRDGLYVALGDVNGDGFADIITGTDAGGGPRVTIRNGKNGVTLADYFAYDQNFRGGVRIASTDTTGDGNAEVITAPGVGGGPQVIVFSGVPMTPIGSFFAFDSGYTGGLYVSGGGLRPDGRSEIVVGTGLPTTTDYPGTRIRIFDPISLSAIREETPYPPGIGETPLQAEVRVTSIDRNGDNIPDLGVSLGAGVQPMIKFLDGRNGRQLGDTFLAFEPSFLGGVFIG